MFKEMILSWQLQEFVGQKVSVRGRLHTLRAVSANLAFLIVRDRDGLFQVVIEDPEEIKKLDGCLLGTVLSATGTVAEMPKGKFRFEIQKGSVNVLSKITFPSPIDISKDTINADGETIHENKVVALRHPRQMKIFKVVAIAEKVMREFWDQNGFTQINSPKIIWFPTEGGAEVFEVDYFERKAYLAQSPQFYKQMMVPVFERVYEIGRAYRAEKSNTSRHMSEILMLDMEMGFIDSFDDIIEMAQNFMSYVVKKLWNDAEKPLTDLGATQPLVPEQFPRISVAELHELMKKETGEDYTKDLDLAPAEEKFICEYSAKHRWSDFVFVTEFPRSDAKFYHHQNEKNPEVTDRSDLIFRGVEIMTLTQRESNYQKLVAQIVSHGSDPEHPGLKHYLDAFKYGMPEEGGFGFGIARFVQKIIWLENVKEAELFPRDANRVTP
jgi:nondiscriminating aspartyl-tRNA synthetase